MNCVSVNLRKNEHRAAAVANVCAVAAADKRMMLGAALVLIAIIVEGPAP